MKIIADLNSKESSEVLNICNLLNMPRKYTSDEEKANILVWRQEKMPIKVMCEQSGRGKATITRFLEQPESFQIILFPSISLLEEGEDILTD